VGRDKEFSFKFSKITTIFFDAGGTLLRPWPSVGVIYSRMAQKHGYAVAPDWINRRFKGVWQRKNGLVNLTGADPSREKRWWWGVVKAVFEDRIPKEKFKPFFEDLYHSFAEPKCWRLFPETLPTLKKLSGVGFKMGIVSNWDSRLFQLCDGLGLTPYLSFIVISGVIGVAKPHGGIFKQALRLAGSSPQETLHVGDSLTEDYWGARRSGLRSVLLARDGNPIQGVESAKSLRFLLS